MKWDNDPLRYEKYLIFDAIIEFSKAFRFKEPYEISMGDLTEFTDKFFDRNECSMDHTIKDNLT